MIPPRPSDAGPEDRRNPLPSDTHAGAIVRCAYDTDESNEIETATFHVPENLLWSAGGMAYLFEATRNSFLVKPGLDQVNTTPWESWRILSIETPADDGAFFLIEDIASSPEQGESA